MSDTNVKVKRNYTAFFVAMIGAIGALMYNVLPSYLGAAAVTFEMDNADLGYIASGYFAGYTAATVIIGIILMRIKATGSCVVAALVSVICFAATMYFNDVSSMFILLGIGGFGGGTLFVLSMTLLALGERPTRDVGILFFLQMTIAAIVIFLGTSYITPIWGYNGIVIMFICFFVLAIVFSGSMSTAVANIKAHGACLALEAAEQVIVTSSKELWRLMLLMFLMFILFTGYSSMWAFLEVFGVKAGFDAEFIGIALFLSVITGIAAAVPAMTMENRFGLRMPFLISIILSFISLACLAQAFDGSQLMYTLGVMLLQFGGIMAVTYLSASVAYYDKKETFTAMLPAAMGLGAAIGPMIGGVIGAGDVMPVIYLYFSVLSLLFVILVLSPLLKSAGQESVKVLTSTGQTN